MEKTDAVAALAALAQDNRLDVFRLLVQAGPAGMPAGEIAKHPQARAEHADVSLRPLERRGPRHGAARRALDDLRRAL